jgi:diguanylate cyclase
MSTIGLRSLRLAAVVVAVGFVAGLRLLDGVTIEAFDGIYLATVPVIAGAACLRAAPRHENAQWGWRLLGLSCISWGAGNAVWTWLEVVREVFPFPSLADVGFLAAIPLAAAGMLAFPAGPRKTSSRVRMALDGVIVTTSLLFCSWALVLGPMYETRSGTFVEQAITLAYPFGDLALGVIVVLVLTRSAADQRMPLALIGVGLLATAAADSAFVFLVTKGTYATGNLIDLGWVIGYLLITLAAAQSTARTVATPVTASTWTAREPLWHVILPYVPMGGVICVAVGRRLAGHDLEAVLFWIAIILLVALGARQVAALLANRVLLAQLRAREVELAHQALHDPLTGLANRVMFDDRLAQALRQRGHGQVAVLLFDLDDFKTVNDSLGHHAGDALLQAVADRIRRPARAGDTVARLGGDEFALLLEGLTDRADATVVAQRILDIADAPYAIDGHTVTVTGSVGVAVADVDTAAADVLLRNADIAMYAAKAHGKGRYTVFEPRMRLDTIRQFQLSHAPQTQRSATGPPGLTPG